MNAHAYLLRYGWSGPGNPLNSKRTSTHGGGLGLTKPILISRKPNTLGVGTKTTHDHTNQWWLRGFEAALKGVGDNGSTTEDPAATSNTTNDRDRRDTKHELYRYFVSGGILAGTLEVKEATGAKHITNSPSKDSRMRNGRETEEKGKKRKRDSSDDSKDSKKHRSRRKEHGSRSEKPRKHSSMHSNVSEKDVADRKVKADKKAEKKEKALKKEAKQATEQEQKHEGGATSRKAEKKAIKKAARKAAKKADKKAAKKAAKKADKKAAKKDAKEKTKKDKSKN